MNRLKRSDRVAVLVALTEGNSVRSVARMTGAARNTILSLLADIGEVCSKYQDRVLRDLHCKRIRADEIWSFVHARLQGEFDYGDVWTFVAIDADSNLVPCWLIGRRDGSCAREFVTDLVSRLTNRVQLTTDGHRLHIDAVDGFGGEIDFAQLHKLYGAERTDEARYSQAIRIGFTTNEPDPESVSTPHVEHQNLTMRMRMRRFTRRTNGCSKKLQNYAASVALHFMVYNFVRIQQSLRCTPAMKAGVSNHVWSLEEVVGLLEASEQTAGAVGSD